MKGRAQKLHRRIRAAAGLMTALVLAALCALPALAGTRVTVPVKVSFSGESLPAETFTVSMKEVNGSREATASADLSAGERSAEVLLDLGELEEDTYIFELTQLAGSNPDITYSADRYTYYVKVNGDGSVEQRAVNTQDEQDKPQQVEFVNNYRKTSADEVIGDPPVRIRKEVSGRKPPNVDRFVFVMLPEKPEYPLPDVVSQGSGAIVNGVAEVYLDGEGEVEIGNITFTEEGVYRYFVREKDTAIDGYDYDDARFTVVYNVSRDQDGELVCERTITKPGENLLSECVFDNIYDPNPVTRQLLRAVKTGDPTVMWPFTILLVAGLFFIAFLISKRDRRREQREKE